MPAETTPETLRESGHARVLQAFLRLTACGAKRPRDKTVNAIKFKKPKL